MRRASGPEGGLVEMKYGFAEVFRRQDGQTMSEYALVLGVISLIILTALGLLSTGVASLITHTATAL
jgi:Flp pilus assembly pilin Flp